MSHEPVQQGHYDDKILLVSIGTDGFALKITADSSSTASELAQRLDCSRRQLQDYSVWMPRFSSEYSITPSQAMVTIAGDIESLKAAIHRLHNDHSYISESKKIELTSKLVTKPLEKYNSKTSNLGLSIEKVFQSSGDKKALISSESCSIKGSCQFSLK